MIFRRRSIHGQIIAGFLLFELVAVLMFSGLLIRERREVDARRIQHRLEDESAAVVPLCGNALAENDPSHLQMIAYSIRQLSTIDQVVVSVPGGKVLASGDPRLNGTTWKTEWDSELSSLRETRMLRPKHGRGNATVRGAVTPIRLNGRTVAYLWITPSAATLQSHFGDIVRATLWGALAVLVACALMAWLIARSLTGPLSRLIAATRRISRDPEDTSAFPLPVNRSNEVGDLTLVFNRMVAAVDEQRSGLNNTLSLLDSMLTHAPIGVIFFDRNRMVVRVNRFLASMHGQPVAFFLGRRIADIFTPQAAVKLESAVNQVLNGSEPVLDLTLRDPAPTIEEISRSEALTTWQVSIYPVRSVTSMKTDGIRWAGALILDISGRLQAEEALRKSEKLAAAGRLAASIAHEINNPLEAVTNLLYLLDNFATLEPEAKGWVSSAQHEVARVSAITQQTLRFYRQSTRPIDTSLCELLDSMLTLHQGRVNTLQVKLIRKYRDTGNLVCLSGELRQLFANLIGNALDAMQPSGGRLILHVRQAASLKTADIRGVRVTIADTGCGMSREVRKRIFEPFFTTKENTGTGLGMWVGAEIMAKHGVDLSVRSREQHHTRPGGTVFSLFFPADAVVKTQKKHGEDHQAHPGGQAEPAGTVTAG